MWASVFQRFIGMEPFGAFRLLVEPHAVTQGFVLFQMDRNVFIYVVIHKKVHRPIRVYTCNTVVIA